MGLSDQVKDYAPVDGWKKYVGLFIVVVIFVALAVKFGVQKKVNSTLKTGS